MYKYDLLLAELAEKAKKEPAVAERVRKMISAMEKWKKGN